MTDVPDSPLLSWQPLHPDVVPQWHALVEAITEADRGAEHLGPDDLQDELAPEWIDLPADSVIGLDSSGVARAFGLVQVRPGDITVLRALLWGGVHPQWRRRGIGGALLAWQERRARAIVAARRSQPAEAGGAGPDVPAHASFQVAEHVDDAARLAERSGFQAVRWFCVMQRDLSLPIPRVPVDGAPVPPSAGPPSGEPSAGPPAAEPPAAGSPSAGSPLAEPAAGSPSAGSPLAEPAAGSPSAGSPSAEPAAGPPSAGSPSAEPAAGPPSTGPAAATSGALRLVPFADELDDAVRLAHNEAFAEHWGFQPWDSDTWKQWETGHRDFRGDWSFVVLDGDEVAGYALSAGYVGDWKAQGYTEGWTSKLGVRPRWRGRGLARALLTASMQAFADAGMQYAGLDVDSANRTGAMALYTGLGYGVRQRSAHWSKDI